MKVLGSGARPERGCAVAIGAFDGVHLGHRALIRETQNRAEELECSSAVVTFDRHPASVVRPQSAPKLLTDLDQKLELLAGTGVDCTLVLTFDRARSEEAAEDFVQEILLGRLNARAIVVGHDFHFGKGRRGSVELLRRMGAELGFEVHGIELVSDSQATVSSTAVRGALIEGNVELAAHFLGRAHEVRGLVVMGDGRGRELGYPTANLNVPDDIQLPAAGIYAGEYVFPDGSSAPAAISLGTRPTFYQDGANLLEAHLLDFDGDLYGQRAAVRFFARVRGQEKFDSIDALILEMDKDIAAVRARRMGT